VVVAVAGGVDGPDLTQAPFNSVETLLSDHLKLQGMCLMEIEVWRNGLASIPSEPTQSLIRRSWKQAISQLCEAFWGRLAAVFPSFGLHLGLTSSHSANTQPTPTSI